MFILIKLSSNLIYLKNSNPEMGDTSFVSPTGQARGPLSSRRPLWTTLRPPFENHPEGHWEPLTKRTSPQGFPPEEKKKDLFVCLSPVRAKKYGVLVVSGKTIPSQHVKQHLDTCAAPGHLWGLPVR